ncbi:LamG domain-containing protein [Longispora fulva]|nr:LamG domain-containing protein [Longispora fulva]
MSTAGYAAPALASAVPPVDPSPSAALVQKARYEFGATPSDGKLMNDLGQTYDATVRNGATTDVGSGSDSWASPGAPWYTLVLDGTDDHVSSTATVATDSSFTVAAWVKVTKIGANYAVVSQDGTRVSGYYLKVNASGKWQFSIPRSDSETAAWDTVTGPAAVVNEWTHLTGVYDAAGQLRLYVNGFQAGTAAHTATWKATGDTQIGRSLWVGAPGDYLPGNVDEVRLWQGVLPDIAIAQLVVSADTARADRCKVGHWLHAGGPQVKAVAGAALAGTDVDTRRVLAGFGWGFSPLEKAADADDVALRAVDTAQNDRYTAWHNTLASYKLPAGSDSTGFDVAPQYGAEMRKFLFDRQDRTFRHYFDEPPAPKPTPAALDRALAIRAAREAAGDQTISWLYPEWRVRAWSANDIAKFIQFGGLPSVAPATDSVEYRMEVEDLKIKWAGCDSTDPADPAGVLASVTATGHVEWQAELAAQAPQRATIVAAEIQAAKDTRTASAAMVEAQGQAWIAGQLLKWQKYWQGVSQTSLLYPKPAEFTKANSDLAAARAAVAAQLTIAQNAAASAKTQADKVAAAQAQAATVATTNGTPVGRGLTYARQTAQVTKASAAAALAGSKAVEATLNAVKATNADSAALQALAQTQAHALQAEYQRAAAVEAASQAHAAAVAAAGQATQAAAAAAKAKADRATAEQAERTATTAAADAKAKRGVAEAERATAAAARAKAEAERTKAAQFEAQAQTQQGIAASARGAASTAAGTAAQKRSEAEAAETRAGAARDAAVTAEERRDALESRARAYEAAAAAAEGTSAAGAARTAATEARTAATEAGTAADAARSAATAAGNAAVSARAAATQATGASERARAAANAADADAATAWSASSTAHAAAADAIVAADQAAANVKAAQALADAALTQAAKAKADAATARVEADKALVDSARVAGQAFAATQSAIAARDAAMQATAPANEAIALGTPFRTADASAGMAVLVGQSALTVAQQQAAVGQVRADEAARAAAAAQLAATQAVGDAKVAAQAAASAAADAASAATSVEQARGSATQAATDAAATQRAAENTANLWGQTQLDAWAAGSAAYAAASDASSARSSATAAERDAAGARTAANTAEGDASAARASATAAETDATAAEAAAANAQALAQQAQEAASRAEAAQRVASDTTKQSASGPLHMKDVVTDYSDVQHTITGDAYMCSFTGPIDDPRSACDVPIVHHFHGVAHFYLMTCNLKIPDPTPQNCYNHYSRTFIADQRIDQDIADTIHITGRAMFDQALENAKQLFIGDLIKCIDGKLLNCAIFAALLVVPPGLKAAAEALEVFRLATITGVGLDDAYAVLKLSQLSPAALAELDALRAASKARIIAALFAELTANGVKFSAENIVAIGRNLEGKIVFLETGSSRAGLTHILEEHEADFARVGIPRDEVANFVLRACTEGKLVGYQDPKQTRGIYEYMYKGLTYRVAVTVGDNGFIVGANPTGSGV